MSLKLFTFHVMNGKTAEVAIFLGQGATMAEAWADSMKVIAEPFRPSSSGGSNAHSHVVQPLSVRLPEGRYVARKREDFEGDAPYSEAEKKHTP